MKLLSFSTLIFAAVTIYFEYYNRQLLWVFKPATILLIIALAWVYGEKRGFYRWAILAGLVFSLIGDIFLINPQTYFIQGLLSFFLAHLCYIFAFYKSSEKFNLLSLTAFIVGILILVSVFAGVPDNLKIAVIFYTLAISTMLCFATNFWLTKGNTRSLDAICGATLFVISDSIIAFNKFSYEFFSAKILILITYFIAQWLIARSLKRHV